MNWKSSERSSEFFQHFGLPKFSEKTDSGRYQAIVYDIEINGKFSIYKILNKDNEEIEVPNGSIVARIPGVHDGITADKLPIFIPSSINQEIPVIGNIVWLITDKITGNWFWQSIVSRNFFSVKELDNIENVLGVREKIIPSVKSYSKSPLDIINDPELSRILSDDFIKNKEDIISIKRRSGFPELSSAHEELRKMPGETGLDGRFGNGILLTYGGINNGILYIYNNRKNEKIELRNSNLFVMAQDIESKLFDDILKVREFFNEKEYPDNENLENITYLNSDQFHTKINKNSIQIINGTSYIGIKKNLLIKVLEDLELTATNIILNINGILDITHKSTKLIIDNDKIEINTNVPISFKSKNNISILSEKKLTLEGKQIEMKGKNINIGTETSKVIFSRGIFSYIKNTFIEIFNSHVHQTTSPGAPTLIPIIPVISKKESSKIRGN